MKNEEHLLKIKSNNELKMLDLLCDSLDVYHTSREIISGRILRYIEVSIYCDIDVYSHIDCILDMYKTAIKEQKNGK